jgi:hypothetical protein
MAALTPADLEPRVRIPLTAEELTRRIGDAPPPQPVVPGCPEVKEALALSSSSSGSGGEKIAKNVTPLAADEIAIYRAVIKQWLSDGRESLNVSATTYPLDARSHRSGMGCDCLRGIYLETSRAFDSFHELPTDVLPGKKMTLVDPEKRAAIVRADDGDYASGLFSLSEIAFDRDHRYAVVSYSFWCGDLCGQGATLVFEKIGGSWRTTNRFCGGWIS